jgi:hypothetical protein
MLLGPLQFNSTLRAWHLWWHRWSDRVFVVRSAVIGASALVMSLRMPGNGGVNQAARKIQLFSPAVAASLEPARGRS